MVEFIQKEVAKEQEENVKAPQKIVACIGPAADFGFEVDSLRMRAEEIDYYAYADDLDRKNQKNAGTNTYVISTVDYLPKYTESLLSCTSLVVVGTEKGGRRNISIMTHQNPHYFLTDKKDEFVKHLKERLVEIKRRAEEGTLDAVIAGGDILVGDYTRAVNLLNDLVIEVLGFEAVVIAGPKDSAGGNRDNIYFDTQNRKLYILRPEEDSRSNIRVVNDSFKAQDVDMEMKKRKLK